MRKIVFLIAAGIACTVSAAVKVEFYADDIVHVVKEPAGGAGARESFIVKMRPEKVDVAVERNGGLTTYRSASLAVSVDGDGKAVFSTAAGETLLAEDGFSFRPRPVGDPDASSFHVAQKWRLGKDEPVYGLGIWQDESIVRRGTSRHMIQDNRDDYVPIVQSVKGWGVFWDNASPTDYSEKDGLMVFDSEVGDAVDYWFMYGGTSDGVVGLVRRLTGEVPMHPKWTLGYYISKERYKSWKEDLDVIREFRRRRIPLDCLVQDWQYWGGNEKWNDMNFRPDGFAEPEKNIKAIHDLNAKLMIVIWPGFGPETQAHKEFRAKGLYFKGDFRTWPHNSGTIVYDAFSAEARDIYWRYATRVRDAGPDAWWMDSTEPDHFVWNKESFDGPTAMGSFRRMCNAFPYFTVGGVYDHQRADEGGRRRVSIMTRSVYAGQQRTGANTWSGDTFSSWQSLRMQIAAGIGFGLTGNPNYNTDIGGFFPQRDHEAPGGACKHPAFAELNTRWMQYALFCPIFRSHGTGTPREPWRFGEPGTRYYDAMLKCIELRYRLIPYLYSTARWVSARGGTWMRPLFAEYKADKTTWKISQQFLAGTELLAAPVVRAQAPSQRLYLPAGTDWIDFFTGKVEKGGSWIDRPVSLDTFPLYAKAGAIVPTGPALQYVGQVRNPYVDVKVFPGADGSFTLYDDAGDGYGYEKGEFAEIQLSWDDKARKFTFGERQGSYPGMDAERDFIVTLPDGASKSVRYAGKAVEVVFAE